MIIPKAVNGKLFHYDDWLNVRLRTMHEDITKRLKEGGLTAQIQRQLYEHTKLDEIYHSNRIEGNKLTYGETREVVENERELPQRSRRDQLEARNLSAALDYAYETALDDARPVSQTQLREIHALVMKGIQSDAGTYRTTQNEILGSRYQTPEAFQVPSRMTELSDYIQVVTAPDNQYDTLPILGAAAAHAWLAQIHPFSDGNGRSARALMNLILMRNRYFPCVITEDDRRRYIKALEESQGSDLTLLVELIIENLEEGLRDREWLTALVTRIEFSVRNRIRDEYEAWHNALDHLKSQFKLTVDNINATQTTSSVTVKFADYGPLTIEKYASLRDRGPARKTWFFGIEFRSDESRIRYLFDFGYPEQRMRQRSLVILFILKDAGSGYQRLQNISQSNIPDVYQVGFDIDSRKYIAFGISGIRERNLVSLVRKFFEDVSKRDFGG